MAMHHELYPSLFLSFIIISLATTSSRVILADARNLLDINLPDLPLPNDLPEQPEPELPEPDFPTLPTVELPQFPELPSFPQFPELPSFPQFPELPSFPKFPEFSKPGASDIHKGNAGRSSVSSTTTP